MSKTWFNLAVCLVATVSSVSVAQRGGGGPGGGFGGRGGGFGGGFGRGGDTIGFILREDVQKELGLSSGDVDDLQGIVEDAQQESGELRREMFANFRDMSQGEREKAGEEMAEKTAAISKKARKAVTAKLSSTQKKRYAELEFQYQVQQGNLIGALQAADIDVSASEREKLNEAIQEVRDEIRKRTAEITRELYTAALGDMTNADVEKLMGKAFTFESTRPQFGGGGPGGGQRGGRQRAGGGQAGGGGNRPARPARPSGENPRRAR